MLTDQKIRVFVKLLVAPSDPSTPEEEKAAMKVESNSNTMGSGREKNNSSSAEYFVTMLDRARNQNQPQSFFEKPICDFRNNTGGWRLEQRY